MGVPVGIVVFCTALGVGACALDGSTARSTLFEVDAEGSLGVPVGAPAPVRQFELAVEHPGVEHTLFVSPISGDSRDDPDGVVELHVWLAAPDGRVLVDQALQLAPECRETSGCGWEDWTTACTPAMAQVHLLAVAVVSVDVPAVHVLVTDPEKTDGERAPGY